MFLRHTISVSNTNLPVFTSWGRYTETITPDENQKYYRKNRETLGR